MEPMTALNTMCHTSQRDNYGTVYTIEDIRYPDYNGKQILITLVYGKNKVIWIEEYRNRR